MELMNADDGAQIFPYSDIAWQADPPPVLYPVPARYARELVLGDELTVGMPGRFFVYSQVLASEERETITLPGETEPRESLGVCAPLHWWSAKAYPETTGVVMQWWPVDYAWFYRDGVSPDGVDRSAPSDPAPRSWLDWISAGLDEPPARRPRPARDVVGLTGRTLRVQHAPGQWTWRVAVSEPFDVAGDISVQVLPPSVWWFTQVAYHADVPDEIETLPIHRLFVYG